MQPRPRSTLLFTVLAAGPILLTSCQSPGTSTVPVSPAATRVVPSPSASLSPSPSACVPAAAVDAWPVARRAAQVVVVPALNGNITALQAVLSRDVGGVLLLGTAPPDLAQQTPAATRATPIPAVVMADQEGGGVQRLGSLVESIPYPRQMVQTMTPAQVQAEAATVGAQMRRLGVGVDLAPVLDVDGGAGPSATNPDGQRSFSADPATTTTYGIAFARGLQQSGVLPVVKHFPGLGGSNANTDFAPASTLPLSTLQNGGLLPFRTAVSDGLPAVMVANATVPGLTTGPASLSSAAVTGLLRQQLGFSGLVMTDSLSAGAISGAGFTVQDAAVAAISAGADMVLFGSTLNAQQTQLLSPGNVAATTGDIVNAITAAVSSGRLPATRLDDAVLHILTAKGINPCAA